ncbi:MAG TPA: alpha/beta hydrolase [Ktedonobacterales bacterium]|jgi:pimeloyl-ACP methyl ester carboxylesterase
MTAIIARAAHFDCAGPTGAPATVFIHGAAWTRASWLPQMEALADAFRVVALDLPGHGARAGEPFTMRTALDAVDEAVSAGIGAAADGRAVLVGLSLGGYVAMAYAARVPERVRGLALSGCAVVYRGAIGTLSRLDALIVTRLFRPERLARMQERSVRAMLPEALARPQVAAGFTFGALPAVYRELSRCDFDALGGAYPGPSLILNGADDRLNRRGEARQAAAARNARIEDISGAGHLCNLQQPEAFTAAVRGFAEALA